ncbi:hypothetical protein A5780_32355 [Nocardia sp. 852002-20019_SCH5090214]|uniref:hypothetical protein n=1 Tax=Nocardia TaxID=1817 RepID=UPI0007A3DA97|nr:MULTISPECIES: hypothetical protein [Nocardia]MCC3311389.1 hypothetical protein [Nocardia africana]OBA49219.1 hypothetical protein A5780_32355 [Nocardia sp. 852002-20019_SCH5090214]
MLPIFTARDCVKAARSAGGNSCVRIGRKNGWTVVWDDKLATPETDRGAPLPSDQTLVVSDEQFDAFQEALRAGRTDGQCIRIQQSLAGRYTFTAHNAPHSRNTGVALHFDCDEFDAFMSGVRNGEFDLAQFPTAA